MSARRLAARTSGQALVEFALVMPAFVAVMLALIEAARFGASYAMVANAAREAAHAGTFASVTTDAPLRRAGNLAVPLLGTLPTTAFAITPSGTDASGVGRVAGGTIRVSVTYTFTVLPFFSGALGNSVVMQATSTMPVE